MTIMYINTGSGPNSGNGDSLRVAFTKINQNFSEIIQNISEIVPGELYDQSLNTTDSVRFANSTITNTLTISGVPITVNTATNTLQVGSVNTSSVATFNVNGNLILPAGGDILNSNGNSVLGVSAGDNNIWVETFASDQPTTDFVQGATSVEYDADGNVIALFSHYIPGADDSSYTSVAKLTPTGAVLWQVRFSASTYSDGWGLAYDTVNNVVYVAGRASGTPLPYYFATLTKLNGLDGSIIWSKTYDFEADSQSAVVDVDGDGNPVMVGYAYNGTDNYITTSKINKTDGSVLWSKTLDGQGDDQAYGMAIGPSNEIVTIGYVDTFGLQDVVATVVAEPVSNVNWTNERPVFNNGFSCTVSFPNGDGVPVFSNIEDTLGNRAIGGTLATILGSNLGDNGVDGVDDLVIKVDTLAANDTNDRMVVVKYAADGTIAWQKAVQFDAGYNCSGADADIDSAGNIYVCGQYQYDFNGGTTSAMSLVKFNSSGVKQWSRRVVGNCDTFGTSVVVGDDDQLYLSGITANNNASDYIWAVAKYNTDGVVTWQRLIDNTTTWSFGGTFWFGGGGGSNIAVKNGYVALAGTFGDPGTQPLAVVLQIDTDATPFSVGDWDIKGASFSGLLNGSASDITVVDANKTSGVADPTVGTFASGEDTSNFLTVTRYGLTGGDSSLVNGAYTVTLGNTGTVTLPAGGTITEGYVTSNPTIQLTPASPDVASQKLVIKGGGAYNASANGIGLNWYIINPLVNDTVEIYVNSPGNANQTLYWWIYPEGAGIAGPESGTVLLNNGGSGDFGFTVDSDDYEFTVRVSPEANNYDPASGVETQLFNSSAPTLDADHHLHLTTGDLTETSIFLGIDNHNVRTTVNGGIEITTPNIDSTNVWRFDNDGILTVPGDGIIQSVNNNGRLRSQLRLDQGSDITRLSAWSSPDSVSFGDSDWITGTYTNNNGAGVIEFTGAGNIISWLNANNYADRFFFSVNGGPQMANEGYGGGVSDIIFNVATPPETGTNTVTSFSIYYQFESRLDIDTDDQEFYILSTNNDLYLETRQSGNIQIRSVDNLDLVGNGIVTLRNNSTSTGIQIRTDDSDHIWNFGVDGNLTFPDGTTTTGDTVVSPSTYNIQSIGNTLIQTSANAGAKTWTFGTDGKLTFPGAVVNSTVAKTGATIPTTTGIPDALSGTMVGLSIVDGTYGPFTKGGVTFSVTVAGGGISGFINISSTTLYAVNASPGTLTSEDLGDPPGQTTNINVISVVQETPTALDLTKSVNKLTDGNYTLADGTEGQIMCLVRQTGSIYNAITVNVANARIDGALNTTIDYYPFDGNAISLNMSTLIFTDGAWQADNGSWD